jgi:hypothetical protein
MQTSKKWIRLKFINQIVNAIPISRKQYKALEGDWKLAE